MLNERPLYFILRCIKLRKKLILTSKTNGEIEYDEVRVSGMFLRSAERGLESNLTLQEIKPVLEEQLVKIYFQPLKKLQLMRGAEQGISLKDPVK